MNESGEGVVYYGRTISIREIESDTKFPRSTIQRWIELLTYQDYIRTEKSAEGMTFWILNAKRKSKSKRPTDGTPTVPPMGHLRPTDGTDFSSNPQIQKQLIEKATKIASKNLQYNTTAAAKAAAVPSLSLEEQKQELKRKGFLQ